ncbi:hypothetical protein NBRC116602_28990 [Hyphomicrobiales bacterium 4NK60-0047b]|jgi:hypothetical protein
MAKLKFYFLVFFLCVFGFLGGFLFIDFSINKPDNTVDYSTENYHFFFNKRTISTGTLKAGWGRPEDWGVWSVAKVATLSLPIKKYSIKKVSLQFEIQIFKGGKSPQKIDVLINGHHAKTWHYKNKSDLHKKYIELTLPRNSSSNRLKISFKVSKPISPKELRLSGDDRKLGIGISQVNITTSSWDPYNIVQ